MRIAVDVMGGDHGPAEAVAGACKALEENSAITQVLLVGQLATIKSALRPHAETDRLRIVPAADVLTMEDKPVEALRQKKDTSIARAVALLKEGEADALVSPGNTGGIVAAATLGLRTIEGIDRPALAAVIPAPANEFLLLDAGANVECKPAHLAQFAVLGNTYATEVQGKTQPRVGLLNVGSEDVKGTEMIREAHQLCRGLNLNFVGNLEGRDLFSNHADVVVTDGFVGNIVLKTTEGLAAGLFGWLREAMEENPKRQLGAFLTKNAFRSIQERHDPDTLGGAPLLGLRRPVMIVHGNARAAAIAKALAQAATAVSQKLTQRIAAATEALNS